MRKSPTKYTQEDFDKVKKLMDEGYSMNQAAKLSGMRWSVAAYRFRPGYKKYQRKAADEWLKNNLEKKRKTAREYGTRARKAYPERMKAVRRRFYLKHQKEILVRRAEFRKNHPDKIRGYQIKKRDERRARRLRIKVLAEHFKAIISEKKGLTPVHRRV